MSPIDSILSGLTKVHLRQPGQWSARCPAHDDKGPSLSVRETPEGAVLLHCFAGCKVAAIVGALCLDMADLFPPRLIPPCTTKRTSRLLSAGQALDLLADESLLVAVAAANVSHGVALTTVDKNRVLRAAGYIQYLRHECMGGQYA